MVSFDCIAVFHSVHDVMAASKIFRRKKLRHDLVPTPRHLSSDCGMAVEFHCRDGERLRSLLAGANVPLRGVHEK